MADGTWKRVVWACCVWLNLCAVGTSADQPWITVAPDQRGFVTSAGQPFIPWGANYDHDPTGRLLEDYWVAEWDRVEEDFRELRELGFNVVRIHLQTGKFLRSPTEHDPAAIERLKQLVDLAESNGLYLDITGLGCYHKVDVPAWYDALGEAERWAAQAKFWEVVAAAVADSPAIFCLDLMNEPVVSGGPRPAGDWLGPAFGDKHFVQFISLDPGSRTRPEVAKAWIETLVAAIRKVNTRHLITVGLVDWSLERPGLTSGFVPTKVCEPLDFVAVHLYPEKDHVPHALETLAGFQIGKPVVIEETFPLKCSFDEMRTFLREARGPAAGVISFYWGQTPEELERAGTLPAAIQREWLRVFREARWQTP